MSPLERRYLLEFITEELQKQKEIIDKAKNEKKKYARDWKAYVKNQYINILVYLENWPWTRKNAFKIAFFILLGGKKIWMLEKFI